MARSTIASIPSDIFPPPFVEFTVPKPDLMSFFYGETANIGYAHTHSCPFVDFMHTLSIFQGKVKFLGGSVEKWQGIMHSIKTGQTTNAFDIFSTITNGEFLELELPWMEPYTSKRLIELGAVFGDSFIGTLRNIIKGCVETVLWSGWLTSNAASCRTRMRVSFRQGSNCVRMDTVHTDVWFPTMEQGVRIEGVTRKFHDLSEGPLGLEPIERGVFRSFGFNAVQLGITIKQMRPDMSMAQNMTWNMVLQFIATRLGDLNSWVLYKDSFFAKVRANIPLGMFLGQQIVVVEGSPAVLLNTDPSEMYGLFKDKCSFAHQLRWQGIHAAPTTAAIKSGSSATLSLLGKKTRSSRRKYGQGYLLYNRETTEQLSDALRLERGTADSFDVLNDYLGWYQGLRDEAKKMVKRHEGSNPEWGRWGFKPLGFAGYPGNAKIYVKLVE